MTFEKVAEIIADNRDIDVATVRPETSLDELGLDSLDTVELVMAFEEAFGLTIEAQQDGFKTVGDIVALIDSLRT